MARIPKRLRATTGVSVSVDYNDEAVRKRLADLIARGEDPSPAMAAIAEHLRVSAQQRFEAEAGPGGAKWPPLARSTLKRLRKGRTSPKILRDQGFLYASLTAASDDQSAIAGSNLIYARIHQLGGDIVQPERAGSAMFRFAKEGAGSKKDADGKVTRFGSKLRFAKRSSKAKGNFEKTFIRGETRITMPARPYLGFDAADQVAITEILTDHFGGGE